MKDLARIITKAPLFLIGALLDAALWSVGQVIDLLIGMARVIVRVVGGSGSRSLRHTVPALIPERLTAKHIGAALHGDDDPLKDTPKHAPTRRLRP